MPGNRNPRNGLIFIPLQISGTGLTGRPRGTATMEMNGRSAVLYLVRTPRVPFFMFILLGLEAKGLLAFQGRRGICVFGVVCFLS